MVAIVCDQYISISKPMKRRISRKNSLTILIFCWFIPAAVAAPTAYYSTGCPYFIASRFSLMFVQQINKKMKIPFFLILRSYCHTIMTMTASIGRSKSYYHTIMTMTATIGRRGFTSTYDSCHGHDCMMVGFTSTYGSCHGHDCMIVGFTW
jgi:hypothetical protein